MKCLVLLCSGMLAAGLSAAPPLPATIDNETRAAHIDGHPTSQPEPVALSGRLAIRAVQGTPDASPIVSVAVKVEFHGGKSIIETRDGWLDEFGILIMEDVPIGSTHVPVAEIEYAGVTYRQVGPLMDAGHAHATIDVVCYEVTEEPPTWSVAMRHVMISPTAGAVRVTEVLIVENPELRTWLGAPAGDGRPVTTMFTVPEGASDFTFGRGFTDDCCSTFADGRFINHLPLVPGRTELNVSYLVPRHDGTLRLDLGAPAAVGRLMIVVPDTMPTEDISGLELGGTRLIGQTQVRYYQAQDQLPGQRVGLTLVARSNQVTPVVAEAPTGGTARVVAAVGGGVVLLFAFVLLVIKPSRPATQTGDGIVEGGS